MATKLNPNAIIDNSIAEVKLVDSFQQKSDNNLQTDSKSVVGAINEINVITKHVVYDSNEESIKFVFD